MDKNAGFGFKKAVDIFKRPVCGLWIEKVSDRNEGETDDSPDDPEFVAKVLNAG